MTKAHHAFSTATAMERTLGATKRRSDEATKEKGTKGKWIRSATASFFVIATLLTTSCVRRTINITTEPPNARVFLNDQEVGRSAVTTDFLWYGDYGVTIRKEGFETLQTNWIIKPPWYQHIPLDFFTEVFWPGQLHDIHSRHFILEPAKIPTQEELIGRAGETRDRALDARK